MWMQHVTAQAGWYIHLYIWLYGLSTPVWHYFRWKAYIILCVLLLLWLALAARSASKDLGSTGQNHTHCIVPTFGRFSDQILARKTKHVKKMAQISKIHPPPAKSWREHWNHHSETILNNTSNSMLVHTYTRMYYICPSEKAQCIYMYIVTYTTTHRWHFPIALIGTSSRCTYQPACPHRDQWYQDPQHQQSHSQT